jgi:Ligand-gated ion channel
LIPSSSFKNEGENYTPTKNVVRLIAAGWCLAAIVLVNVYNGQLVSYLTVPKFETVVNSFNELAHSKTPQLALPKGTIIAQFCLVSIWGETGNFTSKL